jgi:putative CocE/NonD family hydrolase
LIKCYLLLWSARQQLLTLLGVLSSLFKTSVKLRLENLALQTPTRRAASVGAEAGEADLADRILWVLLRRADVLTFKTDMLTATVKISGEPVANLVASTTGTDSGRVVKLIDVYPDEVPGQPELGWLSARDLNGHFPRPLRESLSQPRAVTPDTPQLYRFALPTVNHVFMPGHRIMVQVQSSWFPLYDRNPQTFVPNILFANAANYKKATQRIYHAPGHASFVELPLVTPER